MILPCNCGATSSGRWADVHAPTCETFGETVEERHAYHRQSLYRAIDAQVDAYDVKAVRHYRLWLEKQGRWASLADFDRRGWMQQTELARQWEDQMDEGQYRQEQALGGPIHDRERYADSGTSGNLE